jgi:hypothetical protein
MAASDLNPCDFYLWGYFKSVVKKYFEFEKSCQKIITAGDGHIETK